MMNKHATIPLIQRMIGLVSLPWGAFVAVFLYYAALAAMALAGVSPATAVVGTAYLAPAVAYIATVAARLGTTLLTVAPQPPLVPVRHRGG